MKPRLKIGVFHALGDFSNVRKTSLNHCKYLERYQPDHDYFYHHIGDPVTPALTRMRFDAILFDVTFLCYRWVRPRTRFDEIYGQYQFLAKQDAVKLAFPQDEYDHGAVLDEWLEGYGVDVVYSVVWDAWDLMFPRTQRRAELLRGLTGYVDDADVEAMGKGARPFGERPIDVSYRARDLPPNFGRHGQLKAKLGERFGARAQGRGLALDLSNRLEDVILGDDWLRFLGSSKYVLGCEGGSSLWDPHGEMQDAVRAYVQAHPQAPYEEVEAACFAGQNREPPFSAISPRLFEVAAARAAQILVRAPYLGRLRPGEHYLSLEPDLSNVDEVVDQLGDAAHAQRMIEACHAELIAPDTYRYSRHAAEVMGKIEAHMAKKGLRARADSTFASLASEHAAAVTRARANPVKPTPSLRARVERRVRKALPKELKQALKPAVTPLEKWARRWLARRGW